MKTILALICVLIFSSGCNSDSESKYKKCIEELNEESSSYAGSNFDFANYEFFRDLEHKFIYLYNIKKLKDKIKIGDYTLVIFPVDSERNKIGIENQIAHRNSAAGVFASYQIINGDKTLGFEILKKLLELDPDHYLGFTVDENNKISAYFPQIEKALKGDKANLKLLEEEASQFEIRKEIYSP